MAKAKQTLNGKAFEYACMKAIQNILNGREKDTVINYSSAYNTAMNSFDGLEESSQIRYFQAAQTAAKMISSLEPRLSNGDGTLVLEIEPDSVAVGVDGDVRDVIFSRPSYSDNWEIGISCKHNHEALKHPRITEGKDFGWDWIGIHCSSDFMNEISPITDSLVGLGKSNILWRQVVNKQNAYYVPILNAYLKEIERLCKTYNDVPSKLLSYFFGSNDFYKVIMKETEETVIVEGFNMHGTLNKPNGKEKAITRIPITKMPTRLVDAVFKDNRITGTKSKTTIVLIFDEGWSVSMRLHNKDDIAKPTSLAWDVNLVGLPMSAYRAMRSWYE